VAIERVVNSLYTDRSLWTCDDDEAYLAVDRPHEQLVDQLQWCLFGGVADQLIN